MCCSYAGAAHTLEADFKAVQSQNLFPSFLQSTVTPVPPFKLPTFVKIFPFPQLSLVQPFLSQFRKMLSMRLFNRRVWLTSPFAQI